jgi:hypothetical protein
MRAFFRTLINLGLGMAGVIAAVWVTGQGFYRHASHNGRTAEAVAPVVVAFAVACIALRAVPSKAKMAQRQQASRPSSPYAAPANRR